MSKTIQEQLSGYKAQGELKVSENTEKLLINYPQSSLKPAEQVKPSNSKADQYEDMVSKIELLQEKILTLEQSEHADGMPSSEELNLRILEIEKSKKFVKEEKNRLALESEQLIADRAAFEELIVQLEKMDKLQIELNGQKNEIDKANEICAATIGKLNSDQFLFEIKKKNIEEKSNELEKIKSNIGHLKDADLKLKNLQEENLRILRNLASNKTRVKNLTEERNGLVIAVSDAQTDAKNFKNRLTKVEKTLGAVQSELATYLFKAAEIKIESLETVEWMISQFTDIKKNVVPKDILLIGDGPWPLDDFTEQLLSLGFNVWQNGCADEIEVVIVGRSNWEPEIIDQQIEAREGLPMRIYPQELFVLLLAIKVDPFKLASDEALMKFAEGHPVFEYLFGQEFPWPESSFEDGQPKSINFNADFDDASSPLYRLGYSVAQNVGLTPSIRHEILGNALSNPNLPWCISDEYMEDWGGPETRQRLRRIAWHLYLIAKRHGHHPEAVAKWKSDLNWLKIHHYKAIQRFRWPS